MNRRKRAIVVILIISALAVLASIIIFILPALNIEYICPTKEMFNIDCPGCGGTRMIRSLLHGDIYQAFRYNTLMFITLPMLCILILGQSIKYIKDGQLSIWLDKVLLTYIVMLLVFGALRNIEIFSWLQPTTI